MPDGSVVLGERYRLESRIAFGGVGEVWRATDLVLGRAVAVKLLRDGSTGHPETLIRFREEARHAGSLAHPGIAQVYDYGEASPPRPPYLVMELVDGPSLAQVLADGPLSPARAMDVVAQAAAGLAAAHRAGLVHRDIKPANLLLGPDGGVKITDFGIAHAAGSAPLTQAGTLLGTPAYLAPERADGALATPASDLYSLGVVAYECLAGAPPFSGTPVEVALAHSVRPLPSLPAAVPAEVAALVTELTAKYPATRPASADDVAGRAGRLRDTAASGLPGPFPAGGQLRPDAWPPLPAAGAATLAGTPVPVPAARRAPGRRLRASRGQALALAMAVTAVLAGLAGWVLAGSLGQQAHGQRAAVRPPARVAVQAHPPRHHRHGPAHQIGDARGKVTAPAGDDHGDGHGHGSDGSGDGVPGDGGPGGGDGG